MSKEVDNIEIDESLDSLTDEERKAIEEEDDAVEDPEEEASEEEKQEEEVKEEKKEEKQEEAKEEIVEEEPIPEGPSIVVPEYPEPPKFEYTIQDVRKAISIVDKRHNDGELQDSEWIVARDKLRDIETQMRIDMAVHKSAVEQADNVAQLSWKEQQKIFFRLYPDYDYKNNKTLYAALDGHVRRLAVLPENQDRDEWQILNMAKKIIDKDLNRGTKPKKSQEVEDTDNEAVTDEQSSKKKITDLPKAKKKAPTTLATAPAAEDNPTTSKFAYLESLSGEKLERELNKLSEDQLDEYLRG